MGHGTTSWAGPGVSEVALLPKVPRRPSHLRPAILAVLVGWSPVRTPQLPDGALPWALASAQALRADHLGGPAVHCAL